MRALSDEGITEGNCGTNLDNKNQIFEKPKLLSIAYFKLGQFEFLRNAYLKYHSILR